MTGEAGAGPRTAVAAGAGWPALDGLIGLLRTAPARTGSLVSTVYGDAILPRGGALPLSALLPLMARLGAPAGVVRTAVSRLARDGLLQGRRTGRRSAYGLTPAAQAAFEAAIPRIYAPAPPAWDGTLRLVFPDDAAHRAALEAAGVQPLAAGVMLALHPPPDGTLALEARGPRSAFPALASRAWPLAALDDSYAAFLASVSALDPAAGVRPLDAIAARIMLIHAWRRIALRDPGLPAALLPPGWAGHAARARCVALYRALLGPSEVWLDEAGLPPAAASPAARWGADT